MLDGQLGADDGAHAGGFRRLMKARRAVDAVAIEQRERGIAQRRRPLDILAHAGLDEREGEPGVELEHVVRNAGRDLGDPA